MSSGSVLCPWSTRLERVSNKIATAMGYTGPAEDEAEMLKFFATTSGENFINAQHAVELVITYLYSIYITF